MSSNYKAKWYLSYDVLRIIAILSVIFLHISAFFVLGFEDVKTSEFITGNIVAGLCNAAIPLFLMISGALLLNEEKPFNARKFLKNSWLFLVLITILWTVFYGWFYGYGLPMLTHQPTSFSTFINYLICFEGSDYPHMWYMYMIIGMYLLIPVLRLFVKKENKNYIFWIIVVCLLIQFIPKTLGVLTVDAEFTIKDFMSQFFLNPATGYIAYFFLGWYLSTFELSKNKRKILYALGIICGILAIWAVQTYIPVIPTVRNYVYSGNDIVSLLYSVAIFVFVLAVCKDRENNSPQLKSLSRFTFGIYIIHVVFLELFLNIIYPYSSFTAQIPLAYVLITFLFVFVLSYLVVFAVSKVKYLRKIFYLK